MEPRWLRLLWLSLVVMRCQPLRRALYLYFEICNYGKS
ncbi:acetyltransferase [Vibrio tarriae]|nr:acetyltransferase [Vibrio tarriae]